MKRSFSFFRKCVAFVFKLLDDNALMWNSHLQRVFLALPPILGSLLVVSSLHAETIIWSEHIAAIVYENCTICHREEGVAPFPLMSYDDVKKRAKQIAEVVESRFMPPWKPDPAYSPKLIGERRLSDEQVNLILQWVEQGRKRGSSRRAPKPPKFSNS